MTSVNLDRQHENKTQLHDKITSTIETMATPQGRSTSSCGLETMIEFLNWNFFSNVDLVPNLSS